MAQFYEKYLMLCAKANKTPSGAANEMGLSRGTANGWKNGKQPNDVTVAKIAQYFNVPVSFLKNDSEEIYPLLYIGAIENNLEDAKKMLEIKMGMTEEKNNGVAAVGSEDLRVRKLAPFIAQMTDAEVDKVLGFIQGTIAARK